MHLTVIEQSRGEHEPRIDLQNGMEALEQLSCPIHSGRHGLLLTEDMLGVYCQYECAGPRPLPDPLPASGAVNALVLYGRHHRPGSLFWAARGQHLKGYWHLAIVELVRFRRAGCEVSHQGILLLSSAMILILRWGLNEALHLPEDFGLVPRQPCINKFLGFLSNADSF